ncbi:MAG: phosphoribosylaminoimidazolesuccinocarboxamide synthase, partial [Candidatus Dormibacteraceae bacterium]
MEPGPALLSSQIDLPLFSKGKVRDTYVLSDDRLLMVTTDRISAYDHVLPTGIPDRGKVLTQLSIFWFSQTLGFQENHLVSGMVPDLPDSLRAQRDQLSGRFM